MRVGYSLLGISNHPAAVGATGLEVDKLNHDYVKNYMETYVDIYKQTVGTDLMGRRGIRRACWVRCTSIPRLPSDVVRGQLVYLQ